MACSVIWLMVLASLFVSSSQQIVDCNGQLIRGMSVYEEYCCQYSNKGKSVKVNRGSQVHGIILCPMECPQSCLRFNSTTCFRSCSDVLLSNSQASSGYYSISAAGGNQTSLVYCDMDGVNCDGEGGWMRVAYLNMTEPGTTCPSGLFQQNYENLDHPVCGRDTSLSTGGCATHVYSTLGVEYSKVCGRVRGYQKGTPAFNPDLGDDDAVIIRFNKSSSNRIWTFIGNCVSFPCGDCSSPRIFENGINDNNYFCESSGSSGGLNILHTNDPLWDGLQCTSDETSCCNFNNVPWFMRSFNDSVNYDLDFQICLNQYYIDEDLPVDIIEIFVK